MCIERHETQMQLPKLRENDSKTCLQGVNRVEDRLDDELPSRLRRICGPPDDGDTVAYGKHNLLQLGVVRHPLVELTDGIPEVPASRLCVEVAVHVGIAVVEDVVADDHTTSSEEPAREDALHVSLV